MVLIVGAVMTTVILVATTVATVSGLAKCASVIFESEELFGSSPGRSNEAVQHLKRTKVMPKLWAPMFEAFIGEAVLVLAWLSGAGDGDDQAVLLAMIVFFFLIIVGLAYYFYRTGRTGQSDEIR